jgi:V/A-type H+-transporting ATPase subunit E
MTEPDVKSSGVKELIDRIRDEGVHSARAEADRILTEAKARAARIVTDAKAEAAAIKKEARAAMEREQTATIEALRIAARDTELELRAAIMSGFEEHVRRLVTDVTTDGSVLRDMILVLSGRAADDLLQDKDAVILVPDRRSSMSSSSGRPGLSLPMCYGKASSSFRLARSRAGRAFVW